MTYETQQIANDTIQEEDFVELEGASTSKTSTKTPDNSFALPPDDREQNNDKTPDDEHFIEVEPQLKCILTEETILLTNTAVKSNIPPLKKDTQLTITKKSKTWYFVTTKNGKTGYLKKDKVKIDQFERLNWIKKKYKKDQAASIVKKERQEHINDTIKKKEQKDIDSGNKLLKDDILKRAKLKFKIDNHEEKLQKIKEKFEKKLQKKYDKESNRTQKIKKKFKEKLKQIVPLLKKESTEYNELNEKIKKTRKSYLSDEELKTVELYDLTIFGVTDQKTIQNLDVDKIILDIEKKLTLSNSEYNQYQKEKKIENLENQLKDENLTADKKTKIQNALKQIKHPVAADNPISIAKKEIVKYLDYYKKTGIEARPHLDDFKVILFYLIKGKDDLSGKEKVALLFVLSQYINKKRVFRSEDITSKNLNAIFGYDNDKVNPDAFNKAFKKLFDEIQKDDEARKEYNELINPDRILRGNIKDKRKETHSEIKKHRKKKRQGLITKSAFKKKKKELKAERKAFISEKKALIHPKKANRKSYRSDKKDLKAKYKSGDLSKQDYKKEKAGLKSGFKKKRKNIRQENQAGFFSGLWKNRTISKKMDTLHEGLGKVSSNRKSNQAQLQEVRDDDKKQISVSAIKDDNHELLDFYSELRFFPDFYLDTYELFHLDDTEKNREKAWQYYEKYYKQRPKTALNYLGKESFLNKDDFWETAIESLRFMERIPKKYLTVEGMARPSKVEEDMLRFLYREEFEEEEKKESIQENQSSAFTYGKETIQTAFTDKTINFLNLLQIYPRLYKEAYELQEAFNEAQDPNVKKQTLYDFYQQNKSVQEYWGNELYSNPDALWANTGGDFNLLLTRFIPARYFEDKNLVTPLFVYNDLQEAIEQELLKDFDFNKLKSYKPILDPILKQLDYQSTLDYGLASLKGFADKNKTTLSLTGLGLGISSLILSDVYSKDSNIFKSLWKQEGDKGSFREWAALGLLNEFKLEATVLDINKTSNFGLTSQKESHKLKFSNQAYGDNAIKPVYLNPSAINSELSDPGSSFNPGLMTTNKKENVLPNIYGAAQYDFLSQSDLDGDTQKKTSFSANLWGQYFLPNSDKLADREPDDYQTYSLVNQVQPFIKKNLYQSIPIDIENLSGMNLPSLLQTDTSFSYLDTMPDQGIMNMGGGFTFSQKFTPYFSIDSGLNFTSVNSFSGGDDMQFWSANLGVGFDKKLGDNWNFDANVGVSSSFTNDLTPSTANPNGISQSHMLEGDIKISSDFMTFNATIKDNLLKPEKFSTYNFKLQINDPKILNLPEGSFSAYLSLSRLPAHEGANLPAVWIPDVGIQINLDHLFLKDN